MMCRIPKADEGHRLIAVVHTSQRIWGRARRGAPSAAGAAASRGQCVGQQVPLHFVGQRFQPQPGLG
eukprot:4728124-Pyramimonas_sp.AAC.1